MNSIKNFMEIFESKRATESWLEMKEILKECHQYFTNIPTSERGVSLSILYNEKNGLLTFLANELDRPHLSRNLEGTIIETLKLLIFIVNEFSDYYKPYIEQTMNVLNLAMTIKSTYYLKDAAAKTFINFVEVFKTHELDFNGFMSEWVKKFRLYSVPERRLLLHIISVIALHFPQTEAFGRLIKLIMRQLISDYTDTYQGKKRSMQCLTTYIEALDNILYNFSPSDDDVGTSRGSDSIYHIIKNLCNSEENQNNNKLMLVIVHLLSQHLSLFDEYVYEDYQFWHSLLGSCAKKPICQNLAIKALRNYYRTMGTVLGRKKTARDKEVFFSLRDSFVRNLSDVRICSTELRLNVYGFSQIIEPCKNYLAAAGVEEMFSLIAHRTIPLYSREDDESARLEEIADYQEALSRIIRYLENVSVDQIRALTTLCFIMIKRFPELSFDDQQYAIMSLNRTIINVRYTKEFLYQDFITNIVYDGIVWSCSHMLLIDAEFKREVDEKFKYPVTYKDYVPLWRGLTNPENYLYTGENSDTRGAALQMVVDEILRTCISLINTLNLNVASRNDNSVFYDAKFSQIPENEMDFRIFLNLVDLFVEILPNMENFGWSDILQTYLYEIIKNSYKHPLISGFHKLARTTLVSSGVFSRCDSNETSSNESFNLVLQYLWNLIDVLPGYPQELQNACLRLVLNIPETFVARIVDRALPIFQISLTLGLTNYEIATTAMTALENWHELLGAECPKKFIVQIVPYLENFLQSEESSERLIQDIEDIQSKKRTIRRGGGGRDPTKSNVAMINDEQTVEAFQRRILLFFGSLDNEIMLEHIHRKSLKTGATWSKKDLLKYSMPFPDKNCDINLDAMLPRIIDLALSSGDRRTRVAASEVLHTIVAFMLGKTVQFLSFDKNRFSPLYEIVCPALLRLGCDSDDVIMQLYHPLMMQLTHWLSSSLMFDSDATKYLVDALFNGLSDETNSALRDVSGIYLAEFVHWSMKQSSVKTSSDCPTNIDLIVPKIIDFALDPSLRKRVAAAIAFNHLYRIIRENEEIVSIFWLVIFQAFVKSLDGCCDTRINDSLRHIERVFVEKSRLFNETRRNRIRPKEFSGATISHAVQWIFQQCQSLDRNCRRRCMDMFVSLSRIVDNANSPKAMIAKFIESNTILGLNNVLIGNSNESFDTTTSHGLMMFQRTLDLYVWLIRDDLIENEILFTETNPAKMIIFQRIDHFVTDSLSIGDNAIPENRAMSHLQEFVKSKTLRCENVLILFDFILTIINVEAKDHYIPYNVFNENFFQLVKVCLMKPEKLGFDSSNLQLTEQLPGKLEILLKETMEILSPEIKDNMIEIFSREIEKFSDKLFRVNDCIESKILVSENSIKGLILLERYKILRMCKNCEDTMANADIKITNIFNILKTEDLGKSVCVYPNSETKSYLCRILELLLIDGEIDTMKIVVKLVTDATELYRSEMPIVTHGEYFLGTFKDVLIRGFLDNFKETFVLLEHSLKENPDNALRVIEAIVLYLQRNKKDYRESIDETTVTIISKFQTLERSVNNLEHRRNIFLNIYAIVVRLKKTKLLERNSEMYQWILKELVSSKTFKYKIRLIRNFLVSLTNETSEDNTELRVILNNLKTERKIDDSEENPKNNFASPETMDCFQNLLKLLPITRSLLVLEAIMNFSAGIGQVLCGEKVNEYMNLYYNVVGPSRILKSLITIYKRFMEPSSTAERLDVLRYFLLPSLSQRSPQTIEQFFETNMAEIYGIIIEKATLNIHDRNQLFVSQIGCYNLMEIMFAKLPKDRIDSMSSLIETKESTDGKMAEKFSRKILRSTLPVRVLRSMDGDDKEIVRLLHCSAYTCCISIVSTTRDERFYLAVFGENREKNQLIWENIIDIDRKYVLRQTSKEYPKQRAKIVNIRKNENTKKSQADNKYSYIKSYDLATSTLNENIYAYDLNAVNLLPQDTSVTLTKNETTSLIFEIDDLNEHECMPSICGLLEHISENKSSNPHGDEIILPQWMSQFQASMWSRYANVRLFLLKIVLNTQAVFRPYGKFFLEPVINTIHQCLKEESLNYIITDALIMLIDWRAISVPSDERGKNLARIMFELLVKKSTLAPTRYIVRYNMSIIEQIVDSWHDCLVVPEILNDYMSTDHRTAVKLILIFLSNKMADKIVERKDIWDYVVKSLSNWESEEEPVLQTYEATGLMLKYFEGMEQYDTSKNEIVTKLTDVFRKMQNSLPGRLVKCIHSLCKAHSLLATDFFQFVSSIQLKVEPTNISKCLEIFLMILPRMSKEYIVKELSYMKFNKLLENKVILCEKSCLNIVDKLVEIFEAGDLLPLVKLVEPYSNNEILEYRQLCYEIFAKLYMKYATIEVLDNEAMEVIHISKRVLLSGLLDPAEEMQKLSLNFWADITNLRDKCSERFLDILDTYSCGIERNFLQIVTIVLLDLTKKSINCETKMFEPLHHCSYNDHDISISWKSRNYDSRIPLFAPSLASQLNQRFTQYSYAMETSSYKDGDSQGNYVLRSTELPEFERTYLSLATMPGNSSGNTRDDKIFAVPETPEQSRNKLSKRFLADWSDVTVEMKKTQELKKFSELEYRREYLSRQRGRVKLYRKYRIGDFPDIEISHSMILGPMRELVKRDPQICKNFMVTLARSMINQMLDEGQNELYAAEVSSRFTRILSDGRKNSGAVAAILEILFNVRKLDCPWSIVAEIARNDGLYTQGAILTELNLIREPLDLEPPRKKARRDNSMENIEKKEQWIELAGLYESMDEIDAVLGIFRGDMFTEQLHSASLSRATNDWARAEEFYRKAYSLEMGEKLKKHCLQGAFECLARLGKWKKLENDIDIRINGNYKDILSSDSRESRWIVPWIFRTHTQRILESGRNEKFSVAMKSFLNDSSKSQYLKEHYGEETAVILCPKKPQISRDFLNGSWENVRQKWLTLSPLAVSTRSRAILKLRGIYDIDNYLRTIEGSDINASSRKLMNCWKNSVPSVKDDLLAWDIHVSYRSYFSVSLIKAIGAYESQESVDVIKDIRTVNMQQMLKIIDCSLKHKNRHLAKKFLLRIERELNHCECAIIDDFELSAVRFKILDAQLSANIASLEYYTSAWKKSHEILRNESLSPNARIAVRQIISELSTYFAQLGDENFLKKLTTETSIVPDIFANCGDNADILDSLKQYSLTNLQECCTFGTNVADCNLRLSKYCYERISSGNGDTDLSREFVRSTLTAMSYGSEEATYYFPCLLKNDILSNDEIRQIFIDGSATIETWRFLIWQTQLLSYLGTSLSSIVMPIVRKMMEAYPNAMVYSLRLVLDTSSKLGDDSSYSELENFLGVKQEFNKFLQALEYVVLPKEFLQYYLYEFLKNFKTDRDGAVKKLLRKLYPIETEDTSAPLQGDVHRDATAPLKSDMEKMLIMPIGEIEQHVHCMLKRSNESLKKRTYKTGLKSYSPWLSEYVGRDIEVPGQYNENKKPIPRYHTKIIKIEPKVKIMQSIRKPIRITIVASDGKNYHFLVKFGEDLRLDQRVEQIFDVMNDKLKSDAACSSRRLSIDTYQVFPLSGSLGFLQWIDNTKTLAEYVNYSLNDKEKEVHSRVESEYEDWIKKASPGKLLSTQYKEALVKYKAGDVEDKMGELKRKISGDCLRRTFVCLTTCMESFMSLRRNFTSSYATMCIGQWILGIGDRHTSNTLIRIESGRCLGIDFGSAFGGGIDQTIPELMPFRLTSQIKGLLEPFNEYDSLGTTMIHVLRALRNSKGSLLACLDVVAHEQLNWQEHVNKLSQEMNKAAPDIEWLPAKKVRIVSKKLDGVKPSTITLEQLAENHSEEPYFSRYSAIVNGTDSLQSTKRSALMESNLSPEEQVECLIEQATDLNILGRTYVGWAPWL